MSLNESGGTIGRKLISIVTPVFNEEENIEPFYAAVNAALAGERDRYDFEFVFTDNHSSDSTFIKIHELVARDDRVRAFRFSKNFGYQKSIYTGYMKARGRAAVQLDVDLQDPPELIPQFLRLWEQGYFVVYGIRRNRRESLLLHATRRGFYWLVDALSTDTLPRDAGDFRLIDRRIIDELRKIRDTNIYIRGRIAAMGFRQIGVTYDRAARQRGESKFGFFNLLALSVDAIVSHSTVPLRIATWFGLFAIAAAVLAILGYIAVYFLTGKSWPAGFTTITVLLLFNIGVTSLLLGVIGAYLGRIFEQLKTSPDSIIETEIDQQRNANQRDAAPPSSSV